MLKRPVLPEDLLRLASLGDPQISPDGKRILFTHKSVGEKNKYVTNLWTVDLKGALKQWTQGEAGASQGRWSPDGRRIAFVSKREGSAAQIQLIPVSGGEAGALTKLPEGSIGEIRWSPDGNKIAFTFREQHPDWTTEAKKKREEDGLSDSPRITERAMYRLDGDGYFMEQRYAVYVVDADSGGHSRILEGCPFDGYSFDWSPDSARLAISKRMGESPWRDPADDLIYLVDMKGKACKVEGLPRGEKRTVRWSPSGKQLAYFGNEDPFDHRGVKNTRLFVVPVGGGPAKCLTASEDSCFDTTTLSDAGEAPGPCLEWAPNSKSLYASLGFFGEEQLVRVDARSGHLEVLTEGQQRLIPGPPSADGKSMGCLVSGPTKSAEIAILNLESPAPAAKVLTGFNDGLFGEVTIAEPEELFIPSTDAWKVHSWVIKPPGFDPSKKYPAILEIHGGPHAQYGWCYFHEFQVLASTGYVVVYSNIRGSKGYGEASTKAIEGHWGGKDWEDVAAVKDWMKRQPFVDSARMGVIGGSYGGYMVNWVVGHTDDFKAAITDRCVSNLVAKALNSDYPYHHGTYWKGTPYASIEHIADLWRDSPIAYFDKVKTPMLIIHSEGDLRCNIEQGEQVFSALQERGIPSRFIRYPASTSHGMSRAGPPDLRMHRLKAILDWWEKWLR